MCDVIVKVLGIFGVWSWVKLEKVMVLSFGRGGVLVGLRRECVCGIFVAWDLKYGFFFGLGWDFLFRRLFGLGCWLCGYFKLVFLIKCFGCLVG